MPLNDFRSIFLPYCIRDYGGGYYSFMNREYQDLGETTKVWGRKLKRYRLKGIGPAVLQRIAHGTPVDAPDGAVDYWLYDDATLPDSSKANWSKYQAKLRILSRAKVRT